MAKRLASTITVSKKGSFVLKTGGESFPKPEPVLPNKPIKAFFTLYTVALLLGCYLIISNARKIPILFNCMVQAIPFPIFYWQNATDSMPSKTSPWALMNHLVTSIGLAFVALSFFNSKLIQSSVQMLQQLRLGFHFLLSYFVMSNWDHLGTAPRHVAFAFNVIPLTIMTLAMIFSFLYHYDNRDPRLPWYFRYSDLIYFSALMLAPAFEFGYRLAYVLL